ncbi:hypothetical protein BpHYR1_034244 [Brachionus plicatilis]|uniref:Uncharacterized protein n=1 Tax=Brachionus plicatilis TaxID=10195 RepID=A0A3M7RWG2_BRAPC|nr:hypothetical protein BpHYR1_034244 [Brachionus plicatilis]
MIHPPRLSSFILLNRFQYITILSWQISFNSIASIFRNKTTIIIIKKKFHDKQTISLSISISLKRKEEKT